MEDFLIRVFPGECCGELARDYIWECIDVGTSLPELEQDLRGVVERVDLERGDHEWWWWWLVGKKD